MSVVWDDRGGGGGIAKARQGKQANGNGGMVNWIGWREWMILEKGSGEQQNGQHQQQSSPNGREHTMQQEGPKQATEVVTLLLMPTQHSTFSVHRSYGLGLLTKKRRY